MNLVKAIYKAPVIMKDYQEEEGITNEISLMSAISFIKRYQVLAVKLLRKWTHQALLIEI